MTRTYREMEADILADPERRANVGRHRAKMEAGRSWGGMTLALTLLSAFLAAVSIGAATAALWYAAALYLALATSCGFFAYAAREAGR